MAVRIPQYSQTQTPQGAVMPIGDMPRNRTADAVGNVGKVLSGVARAMAEKQDRDGQVEAQRRAADIEIQVLQALSDQSSALGGSDPTGFAGKFNDEIGKIHDSAIEAAGSDANPYLRKHLADSLQRVRRDTFVRAMGVEEKALGAWSQSQAESLAQSNLKLVRIDPSQFAGKVEQFGAAVDAMPGLSVDKRVKVKQQFASGAALQAYASEIDADPNKALAALKNTDDPRTAAMQADDHARALDMAQNEIDRRKRQAEADSARREASAERSLRLLEMRFADPAGPSAEAIDEVRRQVRGTALQADFDALMAEGREVQRVMSLPPAEQAAFIQSKYAEYQQSGDDLHGTRGRFLSRLGRTMDAQNKAFDTDTISAIERTTGETVKPIADLKTDFDELRHRVVMLGATSSQRGKTYRSPLKQGEAQAWGATIKNAPPAERANILATFRNGFGDDLVFQGAVRQMLGDDPTAYAAGVATGMNLRTSTGRPVGVMIERGAQILKDKSVIASGENGSDGTRETFNSVVGAAIPPGSADREMMYRTSLAVYAAMAEETTRLGAELDTGMYERAIDIASGGIITLPSGSKIMAPSYGASDDEVVAKFDAALMAAAKANGYDFDALSELRVVQDTGNPNRFYLQADDTGSYWPDKTGRAPLVVDISGVRSSR